MAKFRKKPVVVQADQWFPGRRVAGVRERRANGKPGDVVGIIKTPKGDMIAMPGDWIITGVAGERYPCKEEIFRKTYEPAPER